MNEEISCEVCGACFATTVVEFVRIDCPNCGAVFIPWRPGTELKLRCVVRPFFLQGEGGEGA